MTTIDAVFTGTPDNLATVKVFAIKHASISRILGHRLYVSWICQTENYVKAFEDCMDEIRMDDLGPVEKDTNGVVVKIEMIR
ncbi:hypothetical protein [Algoriphagus resistens]|uniref:hypothetical protein n=1 Tax=Algoriphagus resistens TaxID=1750590 RepID=UPI000716C4AB|nr:hypothetical protein [Algoriphagus resistens]